MDSRNSTTEEWTIVDMDPLYRPSSTGTPTGTPDRREVEGKENPRETEGKDGLPENECVVLRVFALLLSDPSFLGFAFWREIRGLSEISKEIRREFESNSEFLWYHACLSLSADCGLSLPFALEEPVRFALHVQGRGEGTHGQSQQQQQQQRDGFWRRTFREDLYPLRNIWTETGDPQRRRPSQKSQQSTDFRMQVVVRVRPVSERDQRDASKDTKKKFLLPLHQRLQFAKKSQNSEALPTSLSESSPASASTDALSSSRLLQSLAGSPPPDLLDAMTGRLMHVPVRLPSSGKIMDLQTVMQCLEKRKEDPFTGHALLPESLRPDPELQNRLNEWRSTHAEGGAESFHERCGLAVSDLGAAAEGLWGALTPELLSAYFEAQRLKKEGARQLELLSPEAERGSRAAGASSSASTAATGEQGGEGEGGGGAVEGGEGGEGVESASVGVVAGRGDGGRKKEEGGKDAKGDVKESEDAEERQRDSARVVSLQPCCVVMHVPGAGLRPFAFVRVFSPDSSQETVYRETGLRAVVSALNGVNACLLCYGQTGSGKTHTMFGSKDWEQEAESIARSSSLSSGSEWKAAVKGSGSFGIALRALADVTAVVSSPSLSSFVGQQTERGGGRGVASRTRSAVRRWHVTMACVEIYQERMTDLLTGGEVTVGGRGGRGALGQEGAPEASAAFDIRGATHVQIQSFAGAVRTLLRAENRKSRAATKMNARSSRAHTVVLLSISQRRDASKIRRSSLCLVDLAGSERLKKSDAWGGQRERAQAAHREGAAENGLRMGTVKEAVSINSSLLSLGRCVDALVEGKSHVPFLESKLTALLSPAMAGNSRTWAVLSCHPSPEHAGETLSTLRFGERCGHVSTSLLLTGSGGGFGALDARRALEEIDEALTLCSSQIAALEHRLGVRDSQTNGGGANTGSGSRATGGGEGAETGSSTQHRQQQEEGTSSVEREKVVPGLQKLRERARLLSVKRKELEGLL
uniref:Kinesin-like protein n=1 Tax=Chromera velia CCMP2878 TaxID=1169474 RepID=A0A0G4I7F4_9ALVE|eukprot:Cvel_11602.t1-p1 / transcript=Cvel_11602.t1 / gene=Cvel_11602 / organism=Chromera_velia_CCMP2878 / gene_product=Kinesin-4, putative / transcript_product=Kinesin-4, putative / location=Cvel_scaffold734:29934-34846(+) / protein_length=980 / sequence_SO=supercontig / SO=protein_coding / is_pseudo=false